MVSRSDRLSAIIAVAIVVFMLLGSVLAYSAPPTSSVAEAANVNRGAAGVAVANSVSQTTNQNEPSDPEREAAEQARNALLTTLPQIPDGPIARFSRLFVPLAANAPMRRSSVTALQPTSNSTLEGGIYDLSLLTIPAETTLIFNGPTVLNVSGDVNIAGTLRVDCHALTITGQGALRLPGLVDNSCSNSETGGDLTIGNNGGVLEIGSSDAVAVQSDGKINVTNAVSTPRWEFDVLPHQRSSTKLPPACAASADTLYDTAMPEAPIPVQFTGVAADPDGGPISYNWDFGVNRGNAQQQNPVFEYPNWGTYTITMTASDDDGQSCAATLQIVMDDGMENTPTKPSAQITTDSVLAEVGMPVVLTAEALDPQGDDLTFEWDLGDGNRSSEVSPNHSYAAIGRYPVTLTVRDSSGQTAQATAVVYIHPPSPELVGQKVGRHGAMQNACIIPPLAVRFQGGWNGRNGANGGNNQAGKPGESLNFWGIGFVVIEPNFNATAGNGGDAGASNGRGDIFGRNGGAGGNVTFSVNGALRICGGARFTSGDGGKGGDAVARAKAPVMAWARAGHGGRGGTIWVQASRGIQILPNISVKFGKGGQGGNAAAVGDKGAAKCPVGENGAGAAAVGGNGGNAAGPRIVAIGAVFGVNNVRLDGGNAGDGGNAIAAGGDGGNAICDNNATGGNGGPASARAGKGGNAATIQRGFPAPPANTFKGGKGGEATSFGGFGGDANATGKIDATAIGGVGAPGKAFGGQGGAGHNKGDGGNATANGGIGGFATATGGPGAACKPGGNADATGGAGGIAEARFGAKGGAGAKDGTANATGGLGGLANATGGKGGDCNVCPAGAGGNGGNANATGGKGGDALGNDKRTGGKGGGAIANGGNGGNGATCFCAPGGNGGNGGDATATGGKGGNPGGANGDALPKGGNGGNGGGGFPPGKGGLGGKPGGANGVDGPFLPPFFPLLASDTTPPECETPTPTPITETPVTVTPVTETPVTRTPVTTTPVTATPVTVTATSETVTPVTVTATRETVTPVTVTATSETVTPVTVTATSETVTPVTATITPITATATITATAATVTATVETATAELTKTAIPVAVTQTQLIAEQRRNGINQVRSVSRITAAWLNRR
jgi:PKD repeat protein